MAAFSLQPCMAFHWACEERESKPSPVSSWNDTNSTRSGPTLMTSFNLNYFLRGSISKYSHTDMRASTDEFGGDAYIQSITKLNIPSHLIQKELRVFSCFLGWCTHLLWITARNLHPYLYLLKQWLGKESSPPDRRKKNQWKWERSIRNWDLLVTQWREWGRVNTSLRPHRMWPHPWRQSYLVIPAPVSSSVIQSHWVV